MRDARLSLAQLNACSWRVGRAVVVQRFHGQSASVFATQAAPKTAHRHRGRHPPPRGLSLTCWSGGWPARYLEERGVWSGPFSAARRGSRLAQCRPSVHTLHMYLHVHVNGTPLAQSHMLPDLGGRGERPWPSTPLAGSHGFEALRLYTIALASSCFTC